LYHQTGTARLTDYNKRELGRRTLKFWDQDRWFIELPDKYCAVYKLQVGVQIELEIERVLEDLPDELLDVLNESAEAQKLWQSLSSSKQRMIRESVIEGRQKATRIQRAKAAFCMAAD
jgi:hypothetical protein